MATKIIDGAAPADASGLTAMVKERIAAAGTISSADISAAATAVAAEKVGTGLRESTTIENPETPDPLVAGADASEPPNAAISRIANANSGAAEPTAVVLSMADKQAFISALVKNVRLELEFSRFGGRVDCVVRSRTVAETKALLAYQRDVLTRNPMMTQLEYSMLLRTCLIAAQLVSINMDQFPPLEQPLMRETRVNELTKESETVEPGWLPRVQYWMSVDEARFNAAWSCVHEFELKYWNLVSNADNQDFWSTAASS